MSAERMAGAEDPRRVRRAYERFVSSHTVPSGVRSVVADSWRRCVAAGVNPDGSRLPPVRMDTGELHEYRARHPLAPLLPMFRELLGDNKGEHIFAVTDATGTLLWVQGRSTLLDRAERMHFVEGAVWSEAQAGTNAPGTALALRRPVQINAAEHYNAVVHPWSCAAAPIRDPDGGVLGVVDLTGGEAVAGPYALALVRATVRAAEAELAAEKARGPRAGCAGEAADRPGSVPTEPRLTALGRDGALLEADGTVHRLSPRHSEIITILALASCGMSGERLAVELSETEFCPSTVRAEMTRLRTVLGAGLLGSRPYALRRPVQSDFVTVRDLLAEGRVGAALAAYTGPLLPSSRAPAIEAHRAALEQQLRGAVLGSGDPVLIRRWVDAPWGADDVCAWQTLARRLPGGSVQHACAAARADALDAGFAAPPSAAWLQRSGPYRAD